MRKLLFLLVGLFTFLNSSAWTVYYADTREDGKKWDEVAVYGYSNNGAQKQLGDWPGTKMAYVEEHKGAKLYKLETSAAMPEVLIFNNNNSGSQDANVDKPKDGYVYTSQANKCYISYEDFKTNYTEPIKIDAADWRVGANDFNGDRGNWVDARILSNFPEEWDAENKIWKFECVSLNNFKFYHDSEYYGINASDVINLNESNNYSAYVDLYTGSSGNTVLNKDPKVEKLIVEFNTVNYKLKITGVVSDTPVEPDYTKYQVKLKSDGTNWVEKTFSCTDKGGKLIVEDFNIGKGAGFNLFISTNNGSNWSGYKLESSETGKAIQLNMGSGQDYNGNSWNPADAFNNRTFDLEFDLADMTVTLTEKYSVYFVNQNDWASVNVYAYKNGAGENAAFPGVPMQKVENSDPIYNLIKDSDRSKLYKSYVDVDSFEQVIFAQQQGKQTRNLDLIGYGVYYPEEELFPSAWFDLDNSELLSFPNDKVPARFNTIYIEDSNLYDYASNSGNTVTIDIIGSPEENGEKTMRPTGDDGTSALMPVEIAGKKYLRLRLPQRLFPDGCWMQLRVYEGKDASKDAIHCKDASHADDYHWGCQDPDRIIFMPNVHYHNGYIYSRKSNTEGTSILTVATPKVVKIKEAQPGSLKINGETVEESVLTESLDGIFLTYNVENVDKDSEFKVVAVFETSVESDVEHYYSAASAATAIYPGNAEKMVYDAEGSYKIDTNLLPNTTEYDLQIVWFNSEIVATGAKTTPDFKPAGGSSHFRINGVADDDEEGVELIIGHHNGFGGANADHYSAVEVSMVPIKAYADFIHGANKGAEVSDFSSRNEDGTSSIKVHARTAGIYNLNIRLTKDINDGAQKFRASTAVIPVRVRPSIESVGLSFNLVRYCYDKTGDKNLSISLGFGDNGDEEFPTFTDDSGYAWTSKNVMLSTKYADNSGVRIYWKSVGGVSDDADGSVSETPSFVASLKSDLDLNDDEYADGTAGYTLFKGRKSAPNLEELAEKGQSLSFIVEQNGLYSAPQTVRVYKAGDENAPTEVEAIETADEVEAVYYNLNGVRIDAESLSSGIFVVVKGDKTEKIIVR